MKKISAIQPWLDRKDTLAWYFDKNRCPQPDTPCFVGIDIAVPAHNATSVKRESLRITIELVNSYIEKARRVVDLETPNWLDSEESMMISEELGTPPDVSYPLYFISVESDKKQEIVYIGKTSSNSSRFYSGRSALVKLLDPEFDGMKKVIYMGCIYFYDDNNGYYPIETIYPPELAERILKSIESQLIFSLQPRFNTNGRGRFISEHPMVIHVQNIVNTNSMLDDYFSYST